jgi:hypothetical protein
MKALALALALAAASPDDSFDDPPAPRWPGVLAMWLAGAELTIETGFGAINTFNFCCAPGSQQDPLFQTSLMVGGGVLAMLAGMMYLAWVQPEEEPWPKSPGFVALATGLAQVAGGTFRAAIVSDPQPFRSAEYQSSAIIIVSGIVSLIASTVWFIAISR